MQFDQLLATAGLEVDPPASPVEVGSVTFDSRRAAPGTCFVAVRGWTHDGHDFIPAATKAGCAAVVCEDPSNVPARVPCAVVGNTHDALGQLAQAIRGWPARQLVNIGITGTNGKSTVAHLVHRILESAGHSPALLGTIQYQTGQRSIEAGTTTPDPVMLAELMSEMVQSGRTHLVMEVSSHALHQHRAAGVDFHVGLFTNLSGDHLDYHGTMDQYLAAKRRLFESLRPDAVAVINSDDPHAQAMAQATAAPVLLYGLEEHPDLRGRIERLDDRGAEFTLEHGRRQVTVVSSLIGKHNVLNCLAAAGAGVALDVDLPTIAVALGSASPVPGRLQRVPGRAPYQIFVDYAHTDDALANVLSSLRQVVQGRLMVVFGCGGDRDRSKRQRMGRVAAQMADHVIVTSDNPRSEDPVAIIDEILAGLDTGARNRCDVQPDRRKAIAMAIDLAADGDIVLLAGKGHEKYQQIGDRRVEFSDMAVAGELIRRGGGVGHQAQEHSE
jgi:UDP-N-acetylmuramoyl-L-alanyl-D-glutamate--2,6-diaminopimelate ligase